MLINFEIYFLLFVFMYYHSVLIITLVVIKIKIKYNIIIKYKNLSFKKWKNIFFCLRIFLILIISIWFAKQCHHEVKVLSKIVIMTTSNSIKYISVYGEREKGKLYLSDYAYKINTNIK